MDTCPAIAWRIAKESNIPKIVLGEIADRLGIRITNCQIGCFEVDKVIHDNPTLKDVDDKIVTILEALDENGGLSCARVFELAQELKLTPMAIADIANLRNWRVRDCQLGCF